MHPPRTRRTAVRAALVALTAVFAVLAAAAPASAATQFSAWDVGEDGCTNFVVEGAADWSVMGIPEQPPVKLTGKTYTYVDGWVCLPIVNQERHVEFIGYDRDGKAVAELRIPVSTAAFPGSAAFEEHLAGPFGTAIEYLTVAVCVTQPDTGSGNVRDCGETQYVYQQPIHG